jgi:hypothetical protein
LSLKATPRNTAGQKLWTTFVEPPWDFTVKDGVVELDVMGEKRSFTLREGPTVNE